MDFIVKDPGKPQKFKYNFLSEEASGCFMRVSDVCHALGNCDQYPVPYEGLCNPQTHDEKLCSEMLDAVIAAIEAVPLYEKGEGNEIHLRGYRNLQQR